MHKGSKQITKKTSSPEDTITEFMKSEIGEKGEGIPLLLDHMIRVARGFRVAKIQTKKKGINKLRTHFFLNYDTFLTKNLVYQVNYYTLINLKILSCIIIYQNIHKMFIILQSSHFCNFIYVSYFYDICTKFIAFTVYTADNFINYLFSQISAYGQ